MKLSRRDLMAASLVGGIGMPSVFRQMARAAGALDDAGSGETILVVVQLTGGNDGLNTVIPFADPKYRAGRPALRQDASDVLSINEDLAFHPSMNGFAKLLEAGQLAVIQGVGYPNPNRSHFTSMDIWHKATMDMREAYGWLGRTFPHLSPSGGMYLGDQEAPLAVYGATGYAPSLASLEDFQLRVGDDPAKREVIANLAASGTAPDDDLLQFLRSSSQQTYAAAERLQEVTTQYSTPTTYPESPLAGRLKLVAQLIDAGAGERVYYTALDGFDTHSGQAISHGSLLETFSSALSAFHEDLEHHGHGNRVVSMVFSEFGRRVAENGSQGTDHGCAAPMFLVGSQVATGVHGAHPSLEDLDEGDLKHHTDFRSVYATLLENWLHVPSQEILLGQYDTLPLLKA